jgi:hypothetical protein
MIVVRAILENDFIRPEIVLTSEQMQTVTSVLSNGVEYIYYQGDEPIDLNTDII